MSEGGLFPWKRQSAAKAAPTANYARLMKPLPEPPAGMSWVRCDQQSGKWMLLDTTNVQTAVVADSHTETSATTAPCVVWEEAQNIPPENTPPVAAAAFLSTTDSPAAEPSVASLTTAATATSIGPGVETAVTSNHGKEDNNMDYVHKKWGRLGLDYTRHVVLPTDTLAGLCLTYKISKRELQRANGFYGDNLRLAPETLVVPITDKARQLGWKPQDPNSREFQMAAVLAACPRLSMMEAKCYLETNDWNLELALQEARSDEEWERQEHERVRKFQERQRQQREQDEAENEQPHAVAAVPKTCDADDDDDCCCLFGPLGMLLRSSDTDRSKFVELTVQRS